MKEKLIIKNFGPIKDIELDLGKVTVLIGEQATGKSTVAKMLAVCRYFTYLLPDTTYFIQSFGSGLTAYGLTEAIKSNSEIYYECEHYSFSAKRVEETETTVNDVGDIERSSLQKFATELIPKSIAFKSLMDEMDRVMQHDSEPVNFSYGFASDLFRTIPTSFLQNEVARVMDNPFYLPTERGLQSIFSIGKTSIANLSDSLFNQLAKMDGIARLFKKETYIEPLDIYYVNLNGHGFVRKANENTFYSLFNAASGYQAVIPIVLTVKYYNELKSKTKTLLIEEPELDVFPGTQNKLVQYLVEKSKVHNSMMFLTTHSPYTLTALNNLMYAHTVGKMDKERANAVIDEKYWVNPEDVSVYMMKTDGTAENIIDEEGLIRAEKIDDVSKKLNAVFSDLMDIEIDNAERN